MDVVLLHHKDLGTKAFPASGSPEFFASWAEDGWHPAPKSGPNSKATELSAADELAARESALAENVAAIPDAIEGVKKENK